ncbi:adhesin [Stenotrophomonas bentonitica]|uniref:adhesin n=1 Tax=Stenotrophomonas bentonitica TaxID=1450134 RepID=UPI0036E90565
MNTNMKRTVLAIAVAAASASAGANGWGNDRDNQNQSANINHLHNVAETRTNTNTDTNTETNTTTNTDTDSRTWNRTWNNTRNNNSTTNTTINDNVTSNTNVTSNRDVTSNRNVTENVNKTSNIQADERQEKNNHGVDVNIEKDLRLSSDISFSGDPEITGSIDIDSAAIAVIDNRQSVTNNLAGNTLVTNSASIADDVGADASGNLGFNVAAGDNNAQDNAASLSAADASFSFGMADAEVFVNQFGGGNTTLNSGVTNAAGLGGNAFSGASGNIGANVASGNNNEQKNALAASVATSAYATSSISSNQVSSGNTVSNAGYLQSMTDTVDVNLSGRVAGATLAVGAGRYSGTGSAYQKDNYYLDSWSGALDHPSGSANGHIDLDSDIQNATANPNRPGVGGIAFDTDERGTSQFVELGVADLYASLSGTVSTTRWVNVDATNTAALSGSAFSGASGNIGVNVASGTGNLQANSLALAVAQPSTGGGGGGGPEQ